MCFLLPTLFLGPTRLTKDLEPYIHPLIVKINRKIQERFSKDDIELTNAASYDPKTKMSYSSRKAPPSYNDVKHYDNHGYRDS